MKISKVFAVVAVASMAANIASAQVEVTVDDFESGDFSAYTTTVILDNNGGGSNVSALEAVGGNVTLNTSSIDPEGVEQLAITRSDFTLDIGDELQLDVDRGEDGDRALRGDQDFGLYVGGSAPVAGVRENYIIVFQRDAVQDVQTALFNAENSGGNTNGFGSDAAYDTMFIARTGEDTYEAGYYNDGERVVLREAATIPTDIDGPTIGFYADVRAADVLESGYDNLTIVSADSDPVLLGDVNQSGEVDFLDITPFIALISSGEFQAEADIDESGTVDFRDIVPFIAILSS